jgi:catechol 2,3-dioxygenase-like lactoylglutathione lyase family enzyme
MRLDRIAINAVNLEVELKFLTELLGLSLLQKWADLRQAYVGFENGLVIGVTENKEFDGSTYTMAQLAFNVLQAEFSQWVEVIANAIIEVVSGPKAQRGGEAIIFHAPSKNVIELCYPYVRETIANEAY